ncbi:MAG: cyclic nucleotide-binding domain-containing protein [Candidatus Thiodiazotropha taylori]|uniref:Cyclic nucleotide-binding domain-containing protein n=1 Tax=Candidatus Thiodiazotropha taylori TaxID=2792791 RepID=A0A9E4U7U3_9GAMM|nr:cyclic nucleotide-binding domain-containing protein [Candidatus Thiodiazotropha taylori]MCG8029526.1 cyclic nucleotide-binding domain-containing protein [Candidatus Thiodiazotropha taylori]MCG8083433.1 cyclic nucleotide-binding domain-containing protein [Candidatus Thiodiazotropha taylori]MCG8109084.1 cyclic nucleotide-binding domain-containing protein [Candidatus Thiodiazotropha taylori]MCG8113647.1 cyclic nucleotide-binding domain-containing protein [Candidatus Thiodiazotropha taylori]
MFDSMVMMAFALGIISASSLPIGAITAKFWQPSDRATAILMAFGGGALLAALTIDLVASAVEEGHFYALAAGAMVGGLLFIGLNQLVNDYGGFLRKASTTIYHLRRKQHQQIKQIISRIHQVKLFHDLPTNDFKIIAPSVRVVTFHKGETIFRKGDPADTFYIIDEGGVDLFRSEAGEKNTIQLQSYGVFGWYPCLTSTPNTLNAVASRETRVWLIPKHAIDTLLINSPHFQQEVHLLLRSGELQQYLEQQHLLTADEIDRWTDRAVRQLIRRGVVPPAVEVTRNSAEILERFNQISRLPMLAELPEEEQVLIGCALIYKRYQRGDTLFLQHTRSDRLFILDSGEVNLIDPETPLQKTVVLHANDAFGTFSLLTGARHSVTAVAAEDIGLWELRRRDFLDLLGTAPVLAERYREFIQMGDARDYLQSRHLNSEQSQRWTRQALRSIDTGEELPSAADVARDLHANKAAPLAIWLGLTLDGVPESLVIGSSLINAGISVSLIAGLFLANFPEALSSSCGMKEQGFKFRRIFLMWFSLMILTGVGAAMGGIFFVNASPALFAFVEGVAAGAMLTMIAETMLPEAYFKGGSVVGMSTLCGFLTAIFFKTLEV